MTPGVKGLIFVNAGIFFITAFAPLDVRIWLGQFLGFTPSSLLTGFKIWQPFTYLFLHGSISHILINMLILWMFGVQLEKMWGTRFFLRYFLVTGFGAAMITLLVSLLPFDFSESTYLTITIGASGAIYGLLMAFALYYPKTPILMFLLFPVPAKYFVMILAGIAFISAPRGDGVAHVTHLGGFLTGYLYLQRVQSFKIGRLSIFTDIKYRYLKWQMNRLRKKFDIYPGGRKKNWTDRIH